MQTIVITGVCGTNGKLLVKRLKGKYNIIGIDQKNWSGKLPPNFKMVRGNLRRKVFGEVIRKHTVDAVVHLAITRHFQIPRARIHELNIMRAQRVLEACIRFKINKVVLLSEHSVYGALPTNPMWLTESAALHGSRFFSEAASFITADQMFTELFWRAPEINTVILRPVNVLGPTTRGLLNTYLRLKRPPAVFGFDPMMQIIHEHDVSAALELSLDQKIRGIFNIVGPGSLPLSVIAKTNQRKLRYLPAGLAKFIVNYRFRLKQYPFPPSAMSFFQFPICIDGSLFAKQTNFSPQYDLKKTLNSD